MLRLCCETQLRQLHEVFLSMSMGHAAFCCVYAAFVLRYVAFMLRLCCVCAAFMLRLCCVYAAFCCVQGAILLPIILYLDGTWLSANGNHTAKPCMMGIGNHPISTQNNVDSKKVTACCVLPAFYLRFTCVVPAFCCVLLRFAAFCCVRLRLAAFPGVWPRSRCVSECMLLVRPRGLFGPKEQSALQEIQTQADTGPDLRNFTSRAGRSG